MGHSHHDQDSPSIRLAVLDMVGTTVDDSGRIESAIDDVVRQVAGHDVDRDLLRSLRGGSKLEMFRVLLDEESGAVEANGRFEQLMLNAIHAGVIQPIPGATSALKKLRESGIKVALTSGLSQPVCLAVLSTFGWMGLVDLVLSPEDVRRARPFPDLILTALMELEIEGVHSVAVVGDTANDLLAGHRAGAAIVAGVLSGAHNEAELTGRPHTHIFPSVVEFAELIAIWKGPKGRNAQKVGT
jgi:phosphonatase-like hydrolase